MTSPIVLAHGIARFDELFRHLGSWFELYFYHVPEHLGEHGFRAFRSSVDFAGPVETRSRELKAEVERILDEVGADQAHIIAHSMGGLDARHMIVDLDMADRVASLTTIGTPHHGTSFADVGLGWGDALIDRLRTFGIGVEGFRDLSTTACREFNEHAEGAEATNGVHYQTYSSFQERSAVFFPLKPSWQIIQDKEGDNDGLVPVSSQRWVASLRNDAAGVEKAVRQRQFDFEADHLNQIGLWDPSEIRGRNFDIGGYQRKVRDVYLDIAREVTA